jgi:hypothetical protein
MSTDTAVHAVPNLTLRHWTIDRSAWIEGPSPRPAPAPAFAERGAEGGRLEGVAFKLARLKAAMARQPR